MGGRESRDSQLFLVNGAVSGERLHSPWRGGGKSIKYQIRKRVRYESGRTMDGSRGDGDGSGRSLGDVGLWALKERRGGGESKGNGEDGGQGGR